MPPTTMAVSTPASTRRIPRPSSSIVPPSSAGYRPGPTACVGCPMAGGGPLAHPDANPDRRSVMLPDPLHPAVVHFPIVLMILLPLAAAGALWAIRRGVGPAKAWTIPLAAAAALT